MSDRWADPLYAIPAIPTEYKGRLYRSRLEAKWAVFFDILGWRHEYEPCDLGCWSPDFALIAGGQQMYVEVKPIASYEPEIAEKIYRAILLENGFLGPSLLLGLSPFWMDDIDPQAPHRAVIGWVLWHPSSVEMAPFVWFKENPTRADLSSPGPLSGETPYPFSLIGGVEGWNMWGTAPDRSDEIMEAWAAACNAVQWKGKRRRRP